MQESGGERGVEGHRNKTASMYFLSWHFCDPGLDPDEYLQSQRLVKPGQQTITLKAVQSTIAMINSDNGIVH